MIAFFLELFLVGVLITRFFANKLPDLFLVITSPLIGFIVYVFNFLILLVLHFQVSLGLLASIIGVEILILIGLQVILKNLRSVLFNSLTLKYLISAIVFVALIAIFTRFNYSFASNDSLYIIIMSHNLLETGLSKFYLLSPAGNGMLVAILQTIGMLFRQDYTWSIQPVISIVFYSLFIYFAVRSLKSHRVKKWMTALILMLLVGVTITSNTMTVFTTYIHTNFDSGVFLSLALISLIYADKEKNNYWYVIASIFLMAFVFTRVENILFVFVVIIACLADGKISQKDIKIIFLPSLVSQLLWFIQINSLQSVSFTDQLSPSMIFFVMVCISLMILLLFVSDLKLIKTIFTKFVFRIYPFVLALIFIGLCVLQWSNTENNFVSITLNLYFTGQWFAMWWFVSTLGLFLFFDGPKIPNEHFYIFLITTFFTSVYLLGAFRSPYRLSFYDSANRMVVHILPVFLYYIIEKIGLIIEQTNEPKLIDLHNLQEENLSNSERIL